MAAPAPVGYSGTPLARKLGIKPGSRLFLLNAPDNYPSLVAPLPDGVQFDPTPGLLTDLAHVFATRRAELDQQLRGLREQLRPDAALWISWHKASSKIPTEITENVVRDLALPLGFVDIKICAVSEIWSGVKLVVRKTLR